MVRNDSTQVYFGAKLYILTGPYCKHERENAPNNQCLISPAEIHTGANSGI